MRLQKRRELFRPPPLLPGGRWAKSGACFDGDGPYQEPWGLNPEHAGAVVHVDSHMYDASGRVVTLRSVTPKAPAALSVVPTAPTAPAAPTDVEDVLAAVAESARLRAEIMEQHMTPAVCAKPAAAGPPPATVTPVVCAKPAAPAPPPVAAGPPRSEKLDCNDSK